MRNLLCTTFPDVACIYLDAFFPNSILSGEYQLYLYISSVGAKNGKFVSTQIVYFMQFTCTDE